MLYNNVDRERGEVTLTLNQADVNDLGIACAMAADASRKPGEQHDPALGKRLGMWCGLFMICFEAVKANEADSNGALVYQREDGQADNA